VNHASIISGPLETVLPKAPYPGLRPFEIDEWSIFFGRERIVDEVIERLASRHLVLIHGSSGSGKSSLVRAGVLPKLARQHLRAGAPWQTCSFRPTGGPLWNLAKELARLEGGGNDLQLVDQIMREFNRREATLAGVVSTLPFLKGRRLCVLVDQFEELFRFEKETSREEAELFVDLVVRNDVQYEKETANRSTESHAAVHVVITMRSEFLGECARFQAFAETINRSQYLVPRMDYDELLRAIRRPAELYDAEVTLELADRLIADVAGREDELPLIQHGLMFLWQHAAGAKTEQHRLVLEASALDNVGGLSKLLSNHADSVFDAVAPGKERKQAVERLFRQITDLNVDGRAIRRPQTFRDLVDATGVDERTMRSIVDGLRRDGVSFLTPYARYPIEEKTPIDISHEALIRCWDRLSDPQEGWLKAEFDDGLVWRSLLVEAKSFDKDPRRILSPATTEERWDWLKSRGFNSAWSERYGGKFSLVKALLAASHDNLVWKRNVNYGLIGLLVFVSIAALSYVGYLNLERLELWADIYVKRSVLAPEKEVDVQDDFKECTRCPQMVIARPGQFLMGSGSPELGSSNENPQHAVTIPGRFAISKREITFEQWDLCHGLGGCRNSPTDEERGSRPVARVNWDDAKEYVAWLSEITGKDYRLLSEAEWEYAARAGAQTDYPWGNDVQNGSKAMANCSGCGSDWDDEGTAPTGSFDANSFGLYDMNGNVGEWVEDCYHDNYEGAPNDGSAWLSQDCKMRVHRGGSWGSSAASIRSSSRAKAPPSSRVNTLGFRVARSFLSK
jgi:formylglycine-generating enzyme required for sulfatase activity